MVKDTPLSLVTQAGMIKKIFPQGKIISLYPNLLWRCWLQPTPLSIKYQIKLNYKLESQPHMYVENPQLILDKNNLLPHIHSIKNQLLCLHYPPERRWHSRVHLAYTIIPWAAEWLYHYETWLITSEWNGGGIEHAPRINFVA